MYMAYEIYSNDVFEESSQTSKKPPKKPGFKLESGLLINIFLILLLIIIVLIFYFGDFSFNSSQNEDSISIVGDLVSFDKVFQGDVNIFAGEYDLEISSGIFSGTSENFFINDFNGTILFENRSFHLLGSADYVEFGKNKLSLNNQEIILKIRKKANFNLFFKNIELEFLDGRFKVNDDLSLVLNNALILFEDVNLSLNYDGKFSLNNNAKKVTLFNTQPNINIIYENLFFEKTE